MNYVFGKQQLPAREQGFLLTNGLGGYTAMTADCSVNRCDHGILVAAVKAPNVRIVMAHRLRETLQMGQEEQTLSTQAFADGTAEEAGWRLLERFSCDPLPRWHYRVGGVKVERRVCLGYGENTAGVIYEIRNGGSLPCIFRAEPFVKLTPKEESVEEEKTFSHRSGVIASGEHTLYIGSNVPEEVHSPRKQVLAYPEDEMDGRPGSGACVSCTSYKVTVEPGQTGVLILHFSGTPWDGDVFAMEAAARERAKDLEDRGGFEDPVARQLARSADSFVVRRESTQGLTVIAGYPLFSDWGRDTMIALPGLTLATGQYADAKSILRTFLAYEKDGLVPNLFPEGDQQPMYNTVDAALLLIDCVHQYVSRTGDETFLREAFPVMERIVAAYRRGTHHGIGMDEDGLIFAGQGLDQVTWMDVCVQGILPTPRHGKPVEINAYWYNALKIMEEFCHRLALLERDYGVLAWKVQKSFREKFFMPEKGYLKDVLSGTEADEQLRCNQIWAVSMGYTMLTAQEEKQVVDTVTRLLYTPRGLRTLSPEDKQFCGHYGGSQLKRDLAYHQGTVWVFPMGAYYLAWLKVNGNTPAAAAAVKERLHELESMLREGCLGQLPEIYDGLTPTRGKGCYAQAWSVGEMLRVYEAIKRIEE